MAVSVSAPSWWFGIPAGLGCLLAIGACAEDLPPQSLVDRFRVLGVRADQPEASPGEVVRLEALLADPNREGRQVSYLWAACVLGPARNTDRCTDLAADDILGTGLGPAFSFVAPEIPQGEIVVEILVVLRVCAGGTFALPASDGDQAMGFPECEGGDGATAFKRVTVSRATDRNDNPRFAYVALEGAPLGPEPLELPACSEGLCRPLAIAAAVTPESVETFTEIAFGEPVERQEAVYASWFATAGSFDRIRSTVDNLEVGWTPPAGAATVDMWFVLHDGRGGIDWRSARIELVQD